MFCKNPKFSFFRKNKFLQVYKGFYFLGVTRSDYQIISQEPRLQMVDPLTVFTNGRSIVKKKKKQLIHIYKFHAVSGSFFFCFFVLSPLK